MRLGIDFGTTHTVVACADRGNYPAVSFTDLAGDAVDWFPSVVAARDGELRYGFDALAVAGEPGWTPARSFKRLLAAADAHAAEVVLGDTTVPLGELVTGFLAALREALATRSNALAGDVEGVAVAVPANAHGGQRFLTLDAFRRAGWEVLALLNEPSAAAFEYTHRFRDTLSSRRDQVLVYDLGGGTFDASLVRMSGRQHEILATAGLARLGGDDFDALLADLAAPGPHGVAMLERCREAKERLTPSSRKIPIELDDGATVSVPVADYYAACQPLIERTLAAMDPVVALAEGGLAGVYVVGGASALPPVGRALRDRFARRVHRSPYPFAAVAIGLAICADGAADLELADRLSRHMGVFREAAGGRAVAFDAILAPSTAQGEALVRTYRAAHNLGHFRFVECSAVDDAGDPGGDITPLGDILFPFDPQLRGARLDDCAVRRIDGPGPLVEERYAVDRRGLVEVTITDLETGYRQQHVLGA